MINIFLGIGLGILIAMFLIVPTMRQNANNRAQNALVSANKEAVNSANTVASLEKEVDSLQSELKQYTGKGNMQTSYEKLLEARTAMEEDDMEKASQALSLVNEKLLGVQGKVVYSDISVVVHEKEAEEAYKTGSQAYRSRKYAEAIEPLLVVVKYDPKYSEGYALYYLAGSYEGVEDLKNAAKYYAQFAELFPNTSRGSTARRKVEEFGAAVEETGDTAETGDTTETDESGDTTDTNETTTQQTQTPEANGATTQQTQTPGTNETTTQQTQTPTTDAATTQQTQAPTTDAATTQQTQTPTTDAATTQQTQTPAQTTEDAAAPAPVESE